jgi:polysaccharide pyruvyl transferase WcaK-like protein
VLIAGGYGNGNVGDEAQLAANLSHWRAASPGCQLTVLTPDPDYTKNVHGQIRVELASRISLFGKGALPYYGAETVFKKKYFLVAAICLFNACLIRSGLPVFGLSTRGARLLDELNNSDVLFLSGGGYLTGMTLSRLWDNMLLIRLAHVLGVPTIMSGQTIGIFKDRISRALAQWGLKKAELIYLRDAVDSPRDLAEIGIPPEKISTTFDDALFFEAAPEAEIEALLNGCGIDSERPYLVVNAHYWRQKPDDSRNIMRSLATILDRIHVDLGLQVVFVPMHKTDEEALREVAEGMREIHFLPDHGFDPAMTVGIIQRAELCLTMKHHPIIFAMAGGVPTLSMAFDNYYWHKNQGAQKLFDQEEYALFCKPEDLATTVFPPLADLMRHRVEESAYILARLERFRPAEGEAIKRWTQNL